MRYKNSYLRGFSTTFNILPTVDISYSQIGLNADAYSLSNDWNAIGEDLRNAMDAFVVENKKALNGKKEATTATAP